MTTCSKITSADANVADMQLHFRERVKFFLAAGAPCVIKKASDRSSVSMASKEMCSFASFSFAAQLALHATKDSRITLRFRVHWLSMHKSTCFLQKCKGSAMQLHNTQLVPPLKNGMSDSTIDESLPETTMMAHQIKPLLKVNSRISEFRRPAKLIPHPNQIILHKTNPLLIL